MNKPYVRRLATSLVAVVLGVSLVGCALLKKKGHDAGDEEGDPAALADAATVSVSGTGAKNEAAILRYANETPIANEPALIAKDETPARNFPQNGPVVATLAKGTAVAKIAQYFSTGTLVMFDDPSGDGTKLLGWVSPKAFDTVAPAPTKVVVVPPRVVDAGANILRDAGAAPVVDAGVKPSGDAGASTVAAPKAGVVAAPPVDGKCPWDGWALAESMCRRKCNADQDCPKNTKCVTKKGATSKVCSSDR